MRPSGVPRVTQPERPRIATSWSAVPHSSGPPVRFQLDTASRGQSPLSAWYYGRFPSGPGCIRSLHVVWGLGAKLCGWHKSEEPQIPPETTVGSQTDQSLQEGRSVRWAFRMGRHPGKGLIWEASLGGGGFGQGPEGREGFPGSRAGDGFGCQTKGSTLHLSGNGSN